MSNLGSSGQRPGPHHPGATPAHGSRASRRRSTAAILAVGALLATAALGLQLADAPSPTSPAPQPEPSSEPAAVTPGPTAPDAPPTSTTAIAAPFPAADCVPAQLAPGATLGIGIPRAARLLPGSTERAVFDAAHACLQSITGRPPVLRTQVPIDATRRAGRGDDEVSELRAFAAIARESGAPVILSVRAHDFARCGRPGVPRARQVDALRAREPLERCEFPGPTLYGQLFAELVDLVDELLPKATVLWTAWNEPDHPMFTLLDALGSEGAARRAGRYWARAAELVGDEQVLAGEFSDRDAATLATLRAAFIAGAGRTPAAWALHPYRDLTDAGSLSGGSIDAQFAADVAPAPVWLTEVTARLSGRRGLSGDGSAQLARGAWLRAQLAARPVRAILYLLTPPDAPSVAAGDTWDSALADRQGRARPFICGLAGLPTERCPGDPAAFGG